MIASIPIMAQQMSLLMYEVPLDGLIAQSGIDTVKEYLALNDEQMRKWSMLNPKTINALGKVYTVNRTYTGYDQLAVIMRQDISAQSGLMKHFSFILKQRDSLLILKKHYLKQSETIGLARSKWHLLCRI